MKTKLRTLREAFSDAERDKSKWPKADETILSEKDKALFLRRRAAMEDYVDGKSYAAIFRDHRISATRLWMLRERFFTKHPDGRIYGERALIPRIRIKPHRRRAEDKARPPGSHGGHTGALTRLFERVPEVKEYIEDLFLKRRKPGLVHEPKIPIKSLHKRFLDKCRALGLTTGYPFTTKWLGIRALHSYLKRLAAEQTAAAIEARYGANAARRYEASGEGGDDAVTRPYQRVQCDAHKIDAQFTLWLPHPGVGLIPVILPRIWILAIIDVFSRAVLSYYLVLALECSARDVTRVIQRAVMPWRRRNFTIPALRYPDRGGFPSEMPALAWASWDELQYDNAKVNLADLTVETLVEKMQSRANPGAVNAIERRAIMERLFLTIEENGFHRLPSTTGSHPRDPRRDKPEEQALKYDIRLEHLEDLLEVLFATYNGTPHASLGYRTPLEVLEHYLATGGEVRTLPEAYRSDATFLMLHDARTVRGDIKKSRKPYIEFEGAVYQNEVLARSPDLIGTSLTLHVNPDDLRLIKAFLPDGAELGELAAKAPWHRVAHSLETRRAINALRHRKFISFTEVDDPMAIYHDYLGKEALANKRARPRYEKARREQAAARAQSEALDTTLPDIPEDAVTQPIVPTPSVVTRRTVMF